MNEAYEQAYQALRRRCKDNEEVEQEFNELHLKGFVILVSRLRAIHNRELDNNSGL